VAWENITTVGCCLLAFRSKVIRTTDEWW